MDNAILVAIIGASGAAGALLMKGLGFLARRQLSDEAAHDKARLMNSLADTLGKLRASGATVGELEALERFARGKPAEGRLALQAIVDNATRPPETHLSGSVDTHSAGEVPMSTSQMRAQAWRDFERVEAELREVEDSMIGLLTDDEQAALRKTQACWREYRDEQAKYASLIVDGGMMQPLFEASERIDLTQQRTAELWREHDARRRHRDRIDPSVFEG
jgi:uncharacterized protein YecT (DUF1311 family)